jgi:hypothetical protein
LPIAGHGVTALQNPIPHRMVFPAASDFVAEGRADAFDVEI